MKEPARIIYKRFCFVENVLSLDQYDKGSFHTTPNPLKQFPEKI